MKIQSKFFINIALLCVPTFAMSEIEISQSLEGLTPEEKAWFLDDSNLDAMAVASENLIWSDKESKKNYWLKNVLKINAQSLKTGWLEFSQCHYQLDPVPKIEVTYNPKHTRNLKVISHQDMDQATTRKDAVVLMNVRRGAQVCIQGESQTLKSLDNGFSLQRGPYMRKFLDGYYPMIVEESIELNQLKAELTKHTPIYPEAKKMKVQKSFYEFTYQFEGQLKPYYEFKTIF